jgi:hypothetical protein
LEATNIAIVATERITPEHELGTAKEAIRALARMVPDGVTRDLVIYARACVVRGDTKGAHEAVKTWRANMRAIGVFGVHGGTRGMPMVEDADDR